MGSLGLWWVGLLGCPAPAPQATESCPETCPYTAEVSPDDGAEDVALSPELSVQVTPDDASVGLRLLDADGEEIPFASELGTGEVVLDELELEPETTYTLEASWSCVPAVTDGSGTPVCERQTTTFTTAARLDPSSLIGQTWHVAPDAIVSDGPLELLLETFEADPIGALFHVTSADRSELRALLTPLDPYGNQDPCVEPQEVVSSFDTDRAFSGGPTVLVFELEGFEVPVELGAWSGRFDDDRSTQATLSIAIDADPLGPLITPGGTGSDICALIGVLGLPCSPCTDGRPVCIALGGLSVSSVEADVAFDPDPDCPTY